MVQWCWINFRCRGVLLIWIRVGQGPTALAVGAGGGCLDIFTLVYHFSFLSPALWETARYRLKYCLKGPLSPKQPTNQLITSFPHMHLSGDAKHLVYKCNILTVMMRRLTRVLFGHSFRKLTFQVNKVNHKKV